MRTWIAAAITVLVLVVPAASRAQEPTRVTLRPRDAALSEEFIRLVSMRELSDGRVLLSDNRDNRIVIADFRANTVVALGRVGSGPSEFRRAGILVSLLQDSSIIADPGNGRWLIVDGTRIVAATAPDDPLVMIASIPSGADRYGNVLAQRFKVRLGAPVDSTVVVRVSRRTRNVDTVAVLRTMSMQVGKPVQSSDSRITTQRIVVPSWSVGEQAHLFADGWIVVARLEPYRVEWIGPEGEHVEGPALPFTPTPFDDREKDAYRKRTGARPATGHKDMADWPQYVPAFTSVSTILGEPAPALYGSPDGQLLIQRTPTALRPEPRYDIVGRDGRLRGQLLLNPNEKLLGFGKAHAYVIVFDSDGIQRLARHPWP